jgi:hypothetical protein
MTRLSFAGSDTDWSDITEPQRDRPRNVQDCPVKSCQQGHWGGGAWLVSFDRGWQI